MKQQAIGIAALIGATAVAAGAFGAHALKGKLEPSDLVNFETAVRYQLLHAAVMLVTGAFWENLTYGAIKWSFWLFVVGVFFFSGSLYLLSTCQLTGLELSWIWPITPLGGLCMIAAWLILAWSAFMASRKL